MRARAQFIRTDIAMSQRAEFDPERLRWELIEKPRDEAEPWATDALPGLPKGCTFVREPLFRRGFPWMLVCEPLDGRIPDPPLDAFPLEGVRFRHCGPASVELLRTVPWAAKLLTVEFERGNTAPINVDRLFPFVGLHSLRRLSFLQDAIIAPEARMLPASHLFRRLHALTIRGAPVGTAILEAILRDGGTNVLGELHLVACRVPENPLAELLDSPATAYLETLTLSGDGLGMPQKFRAFGRVANAPPLRSLDIRDESPGETGIGFFLGSPIPGGLQRLDLSRSSLNRARVQALAGGEFDNLRVLRLYGNSVGNEGAAALAHSPRLAGLLVLNLGYCMVGDEGILAILESPLADGLVFLDLTGSPASAETKELLKARMGDRVRL